MGRLTCDQVLVLVDVKLHTTQTLWGICVDVLHVLDFVKSFVHLQDMEQIRVKKKVEKEWKRQPSIQPVT